MNGSNTMLGIIADNSLAQEPMMEMTVVETWKLLKKMTQKDGHECHDQIP
jgi:hypothetical protein